MKRGISRRLWKARYALLAGVLVAGVLFGASAGAIAKSLYVMADINTSLAPVQAYDIQGTTLTFQQEVNTNAGYGSVGVAIDTDSKTLFLTREGYNTIHIIDAETLTVLGSTTAPGASNLAGIVVDQDKQKVYAVDRSGTSLYVYTWDAGTQTLTAEPGSPFTLANISGGYSGGTWGIALDEINDVLYVSCNTPDIYYYSTADFSYLGMFTVGDDYLVGIAVDAQRGYLYTGGRFTGGSCFSSSIWQTDLDDFSVVSTNIGTVAVGLAVDSSTGYVYATTCSDSLLAYNCGTYPFALLDSETGIGNPTGLCIPGKDISYNPLHFTKEGDVGESSCVKDGDEITYILCFDNAENPESVTGVEVIDYLPLDVTFVSATDEGAYEASTHTVSWDIGTLAAYDEGTCVSLVVEVGEEIIGGQNILNQATIDSDQTPPTTRSEETLVCGGPVGTFTIYPNPCGQTCDQVTITGVPAGETIRIYTVSGELVREFTSGLGNVATWDLRASDGSPVKRGTYICYVEAIGALGKFAIK